MFRLTMRIGNDTATTATTVRAANAAAAERKVRALWSGAGVEILRVEDANEIAKAAGHLAYVEDRHAAPALDITVRTLIAGLPVGGGGADIFRAFTAGYQQAADEECARILAE